MKKETMAIVGIIVLMASMVALGASLTNRKNAVATLPTQPTPVTAYQFGYLKDKCQKGLDNYTGLTPQLKAEANRIKAGLDQASYSSDTNGFNFYQKQNEELRKSAGLIETRKATLQSCIDSVMKRLPFTTTELAEITADINGSTSIPIAP